jgi:hypothetical protein
MSKPVSHIYRLLIYVGIVVLGILIYFAWNNRSH